MQLLREQIARQRVGTTDEGMNTRYFPAHEREDLVKQLEDSGEQVGDTKTSGEYRTSLIPIVSVQEQNRLTHALYVAPIVSRISSARPDNFNVSSCFTVFLSEEKNNDSYSYSFDQIFYTMKLMLIISGP